MASDSTIRRWREHRYRVSFKLMRLSWHSSGPRAFEVLRFEITSSVCHENSRGTRSVGWHALSDGSDTNGTLDDSNTNEHAPDQVHAILMGFSSPRPVVALRSAGTTKAVSPRSSRRKRSFPVRAFGRTGLSRITRLKILASSNRPLANSCCSTAFVLDTRDRRFRSC